jgi:hypothetical protein
MEKWNEAFLLLSVVEKAMGHPKLKKLVDDAAKRLEELQHEGEEPEEPAPQAKPPKGRFGDDDE